MQEIETRVRTLERRIEMKEREERKKKVIIKGELGEGTAKEVASRVLEELRWKAE